MKLKGGTGGAVACRVLDQDFCVEPRHTRINSKQHRVMTTKCFVEDQHLDSLHQDRSVRQTKTLKTSDRGFKPVLEWRSRPFKQVDFNVAKLTVSDAPDCRIPDCMGDGSDEALVTSTAHA